MADITMRVRANVSQAQKSFEDLANSSEGLREEFEKFAKRTNDATLDEFTQKQRRLQTAITATKGEKEALTRSVANYDREIQRLINGGLAPQSEQVRRLRGEQEALQGRLDASRKAQERKTRAVKAAKKALKASAVAVAGLVTGVIALTKRNANLANGLANAARTVGMTTETFQELDYAMRMQGIENGEYMLNRLNRSIIDVRNETGQLTNFLENNYNELLKQLQAVENNEEAFTLLMDAIHRAPNEFKAAELAMAAFGRNGAQMVLAAQNGAEGLNALREEARQLGIVSNENAEHAMAFNDAMFRLRTTVQNMTQELTVKLLPALTNVVVRLTNVVQRAGEFRARLQALGSTLKAVYPIILNVTAGAAFMTVMKGATYVSKMGAAIRALRADLIRLGRQVVVLTGQYIAKLKAMGPAGYVKAGVAIAATTGAILAMNAAVNRGIRSAEDLNDVFEDVYFPSFKYMAEEIADLDVALTQLAWGGAAAAIEAMEEAAEKTRENLRQRLNDINYTQTQTRMLYVNALQQFLTQRAKLESDDHEKRKAEVKRLGEYILNSEEFTAAERQSVHRAMHDAIRAMQKETAEQAVAATEDWMKAYSALFGGLSSLFGVARKEHRTFFIMSRKMALVQAGINTALAVTNALANVPAPANIAKAIAVGIKGAAQKAQIVSSIVPSAETGGRFVVPPSRGIDNTIMRVNPGETVDIEPRGAGRGAETFSFNLVMDSQVLASVINAKARAGELYTLQLAGNL